MGESDVCVFGIKITADMLIQLELLEIYLDVLAENKDIQYYIKNIIKNPTEKLSKQVIDYIKENRAIIKFKDGKKKREAEDNLYGYHGIKKKLATILYNYYLLEYCNLDIFYKQTKSTRLSCTEFYGDVYIGYQVSGLSYEEIDKIDKSKLKTICKTLLNDENIQFKFYGFTTR